MAIRRASHECDTDRADVGSIDQWLIGQEYHNGLGIAIQCPQADLQRSSWVVSGRWIDHLSWYKVHRPLRQVGLDIGRMLTKYKDALTQSHAGD